MVNKSTANAVRQGPTAPPARGPGAAPLHLRSVEIVHTRIFDHLRFDVPATAPDRGQWIVVLGENGTGKTTLLRCLSQQMMPMARPPHLDRWFEEGRVPGYRRSSGTGLMVPGMGLAWAGLNVEPIPDADVERFVLVNGFAYGSLRGNALGGPERDVPLDETLGIETLFFPGARLIHAETWLRREALRAQSGDRAREFFDAVLATVASLLPGGERILVEGDQILLESPTGRRFPMAAMSDGYLTTLGWTLDLIARWAHRYRDSGKLDGNFAKDMPCVVLVDELDLHLHPRWQLDIIPRLRKAFPKTTFIVTTHNPLTLQGARPGEVFVLRRDEAGKVAIVQRDVPLGIDANRLLTGDWFGLASTLDEDTLRLLDRHRALLWAKRAEDDLERLDLEEQIRSRLGRFADTSLERLAQSVSLEVLYRENEERPRDVTEAQREEIIKRVVARRAELDQPTSARDVRKPYRPRSTSTKPGGGTRAKPAAKRVGTKASTRTRR